MKLTKKKLEQLIMEQVSTRGTEYLAESLSGTLIFWCRNRRGPLRPESLRHGAAELEVIDAFNDTWNSRNPIIADESAPGGRRFQKDLEMTALHEQLRDFCLFIINNYDHSNEHQRKLKRLAIGGPDGLIQAAELASALDLI